MLAYLGRKQLQFARYTLYSLLLLLALICSSVSIAQDRLRFVAIIVDDLGYDLNIGEQVIALPHALTYSFLPHTKYSIDLIKNAQNQNKEIMLHLPMQAMANNSTGPGALNEKMQRPQFIKTLRNNLNAIPGAVGINNHMGSLLTQNMVKMQWLMEELKLNNNLYFVDSRTHASSIAAKEAKAFRIPSASRDIFLDHVVTEAAIEYQFGRLLKRLNSVGYALAIGHPHIETLDALKIWLPKLQAEGVHIVTVSRYISLIKTRSVLWQASLSPSRKVVKN